MRRVLMAQVRQDLTATNARSDRTAAERRARPAHSFAIALLLRLLLSLPALLDHPHLHPSDSRCEDLLEQLHSHTTTSATFSSRISQVISRNPLVNFLGEKFDHLHSLQALCPELRQDGV